MKIRSVETRDKIGWQKLFEGYCRFYEVAVENKKSETVWSWLLGPSHMLQGLVATENGAIIGLAHFHRWIDTLEGGNTCYLADLFVDPGQRGKHIGKALLEKVMKISSDQGWSGVCLLTHKSNKVGQNLYNQFGHATDYLFYSLSPEPASHASQDG